jgi:hypothetical protein
MREELYNADTKRDGGNDGQVQIPKDYYKPYFAVTEPMFIKPREFEIWERFPGNEWVAVKKEMTEKG